MSHLPARDDSPGEIYTRDFWVVFVGNLLLCTANTLTFRFAEFITFLGGSEEETGGIVAFGLMAAMVWRTFLGQALDRFGIRNVWICSLFVYLLGTWQLYMTTSIGWELYLARAIFVIGLASMFSAALSLVQGMAPPERRTEIIGTYGASGFIGMICGAQLGDLLFDIYPDNANLYRMLFGLTLLLGAGQGVLAIYTTRNMKHVRPNVAPGVHKLFVRYWPPMMVIVTIMMGLVFSVTTVFLTRYATELGLNGIRTFFSAYAIVAFMMRLAARNWSRAVGRHQLIVYGLLAHAVAMLALMMVRRDWQFIPAAICFGFGHALLFPCVVSLAAGAFPEEYRGTGTTLTLAAMDLGTVLTAPVLGWMIDTYGFPPMFVGVFAVLTLASAVYGFYSWELADSDRLPRPIAIPKPLLDPKMATMAQPLPHPNPLTSEPVMTSNPSLPVHLGEVGLPLGARAR